MTQQLSVYYQIMRQRRWPQSVLLSAASKEHTEQVTALLVQALLCHQPTEQGCCGKCSACIAYQQQQHTDHIVLAAEENTTTIKIDAVRAMLAKVAKSPQMGERQIVAIHDCEKITTQAANALLKTLEEPKSGLYFILYTNRPSTVLPTIHSRCCELRLAAQPQQYEAHILDTNHDLHKVLWQQWPSQSCLHLTDALEQYSLIDILQAMQRILFSIMAMRLTHATSQYDRIREQYGESQLEQLATLGVIEILDVVLKHSSIAHKATVATGPYQRDSLLITCRQVAQLHSKQVVT